MKHFAPTIRFSNNAGIPEIRIYDEVVSEKRYQDQKFWMSMSGEDAEPTAMTASKFREALDQFAGAKTINVRLNCQGGDVQCGMAIYNALVEYPAKIIATVDGEAASIASVILQAGDERRISRGGMVMIHDPQADIMGTFGVADLKATADALETVKKSILNVYKERTGNEESDLETWMAGEKWMDANAAVNLKFVDAVVDRNAKFLNYVRPGLKSRPKVPCLHSNLAERRRRRMAMLDLL